MTAKMIPPNELKTKIANKLALTFSIFIEKKTMKQLIVTPNPININISGFKIISK